MNNIKLVMLAGICFVIGCAHGTVRGTVAMKISDQEAHVCMGENEVKAEDKVVLYKNVCKTRANKQDPVFMRCEKVRIGDGLVTKTLNEHYSVIRVNAGVPFEEGTIVERQ